MGVRGEVNRPEKLILIKGSFGFSDYFNDYNFNSEWTSWRKENFYDQSVMNAYFTFSTLKLQRWVLVFFL